MFLEKILENEEVKNYVEKNEEILESDEFETVTNNISNSILEYCKENMTEFMDSNYDLNSTYENIKSFAKTRYKEIISEIRSVISNENLTKEEKIEQLKELEK